MRRDSPRSETERWRHGRKRNETGADFEEKAGRGVVIVVVDERLGFLRSEDAIAAERD